MTLRFLAALVAVCLPSSAIAAAGSQTVLYSDVTLIDGTGAPPRAHSDILVRDQQIVGVGPHGAVVSNGARTVDLAGRFVIPGLIDSHVHLATPPDRQAALQELKRDLYGGVTGVRAMADDLRAVAELAREAEMAEIPAPDIAYAALMAGPAFFADPRVAAASRGWPVGTAPWMQAVDAGTDLTIAVARARGTGASAIKIYADLPPGLVAAISSEAHRQGMLVWAHSAVFPTRPADVIAAGPDSVSHACYLAYQLEPKMLASYEDKTPVNEALLDTLKGEQGMARLFAAMNAKAVLLDATGSIFARGERERQEHPGRPPMRCTGKATAMLIAQAARAGVMISAGTDYGGAGEWPALHDELFYLVGEAHITPLEAIRSAALNGARAMGRAKDMGSVEVGKLADFVVLSKDPLADIENLRSIEMTVKRGREYPRRDFRPGVQNKEK